MGQISKQFFFKAPVEIVWKIWTDVANTPDWMEGVLSSRVTSAVKYGPGLEWEEKCYFSGQNVEMAHKMVVWEEKKKTVTRTSLPMGGNMERIVEFKTQADQTEINVEMTWELGMISMFISDEKFSDLIGKSFDMTAQKWKERAENF